MKNEHGVEPKNIVALDFTNSSKFLWIILGLWSIGARPALINYHLGDKPLLHCIKASTAKVIFVDDEVQGNLTPEVREMLDRDDFRESGGSVKIVVVDSVVETYISGLKGIREPNSTRSGAGFIQGDKLSALIYTSGTTGNPKPASSKSKKFYSSFLIS